MKAKDLIDTLKEKVRPRRRDRLKTATAITVGTASAIWVALRLKRELYGPGGTKLSRYDRSVDKRWRDSD